ncbi:MAG: hypothetical protein SVY41_02410 [Candidatus Nanohaloarchaea archaeon]|nr:hypothetical protein [Candidatus Nanohaloarchaea archaeon]
MDWADRVHDVPYWAWTVAAAHVVFTGILLYQHGLGWNWDFLVYAMNAEYLFHGGFFMEWLRPPVAPVIIGMLQFVAPGRVAEYGFILLSSAVFLYAVHRFAAAAELDRVTFYTLLLTPGGIAVATQAGTELLSLSLLLLFLADREQPRGGLWLGLAVLTRYTNLLLLPLLLVQPGWRTRARSAVVAAVPAAPWLAYTAVRTGDPLSSPVSFLALNVVLRKESAAADAAGVALLLLPTALFLAALVRRPVRQRLYEGFADSRLAWAMLYIAAVTVAVFLASGVQRARFLYPLLLPLAYTGTRIVEVVGGRRLVPLLLAANLIAGGAVVASTGYSSPAVYRDAAAAVDDCMVESNVWVPLAYAGVHATHPVDAETTRDRLRAGWRVVDITGSVADNVTMLQGVEKIVDAGGYTVYGNPDRCTPPRPVDGTRIDEYNTAANRSYTATSFLLDAWRIEPVDDPSVVVSER